MAHGCFPQNIHHQQFAIICTKMHKAQQLNDPLIIYDWLSNGSFFSYFLEIAPYQEETERET